MKYYSLNQQAPKVSFRQAVIDGIAPDKGLYFPEAIAEFPKRFFEDIENLEFLDIAFQAISPYTGAEIPEADLKGILAKVLDFEFPLVQIAEDTHALELFHGPTLAFKDVGARFMAQCLGYFNSYDSSPVTVLVATSGDTGGAVANGFLGVPGVNVVILYPEGKVSDLQERQLTTLGQNIRALRVNGNFDDCQAMVKEAFTDTDLKTSMKLTSANSINVARWLPQMFYFLFAYKALAKGNKIPVFSVPSGNFGNICAGIMAWKMGMPCEHFIAATNVNDTVPVYMQTGQYIPKVSVPTISNAMDVGNPSNFKRILKVFNEDHRDLSRYFSSFSFTDDQTRAAMVEIFESSGYIADPHGAVGYLGLQKYRKKNGKAAGVFLETAHPIKFKSVVDEALKTSLSLPPKLAELMQAEKHATPISSYSEFKDYLHGNS